MADSHGLRDLLTRPAPVAAHEGNPSAIGHREGDGSQRSLTPDQGRDLLEIVDDRHGRGSTIVTSQLPVEQWHEAIANPTIADAILDRLVHNAHRLTLKGDSLRKTAAKRAGLDLNQVA